jgi:hypothetical protein
MVLKKPADKTRIFSIFSKDQILLYFEDHVEDSDFHDDVLLKLVVRELGLNPYPNVLSWCKIFKQMVRNLYGP